MAHGATLVGGEGDEEFSLTAVPAAKVGAPVSVFWTAPRIKAGDWIGLYPADAPDDTGRAGRWRRELDAGAALVGLFNFDGDLLPDEPGSYVFRFHGPDGARLAEILKRHLRNKCETVKESLTAAM